MLILVAAPPPCASRAAPLYPNISHYKIPHALHHGVKPLCQHQKFLPVLSPSFNPAVPHRNLLAAAVQLSTPAPSTLRSPPPAARSVLPAQPSPEAAPRGSPVVAPQSLFPWQCGKCKLLFPIYVRQSRKLLLRVPVVEAHDL